MSQSREALTIMAESGPTFGKAAAKVVVPRWGALLLAAACVAALVATGLTTYTLTMQNAANAACGPQAQTAANGSPLTQQPANNKTLVDVRLPKNVLPDKYDIELLPFMEEGNWTFRGSVAILLNVTATTSQIVLHAHETLKVDARSSSLTALDSASDPVTATGLPIASQHTDHSRQQLVVTAGSPLRPGRYRLRLKFSGVLGTGLEGFYRSSYREGNVTRWVAATQFQATDARRAFPCFDEPALKARFRLTLGRPENMTAVSNMMIEGNPRPVAGLPGYVWDTFQESLPMSTYLVAFAVTDFAKLSAEDLKFSVWTRKDSLEQAKYALDVGPRILRFFESYYNISYPLPKMDMMALPDFAAGAMENWGLITYREAAMLYQEGISTVGHRQRVATVVSHELAHQWFGNLVTPSWWSDLWLNEGFASYVEYLGVNAVEPDWMILDQLVVSEVQMVFGLDALKTSHPISIEVGNPDEINEIFDRISYSKGASIIRMMDHFLTTDVFKKGVTNYLKSRAYSSATQNQLWEALTSQAHLDAVLPTNMTIKEIMDTWTLQTGYPVVTVTRDYNANSALVKQERFLLVHSNSSTGAGGEGEKDANPLWWIPLTFTTGRKLDFSTTKPSHWLKDQSLQLDNIGATPDEWVIFNIQETGFYRVNYDDGNWRLLGNKLQDPANFREIAVPNRAQLVDDALNLARGGLLNYSLALDMTRYLEHETEYIPWKAALSALHYIDSMFATTGHYDKLKKYVLHLTTPLYNAVGFTDNSDDPLLLVKKRLQHLNWVCGMGHRGCVRSASALFQQWKNSTDPDNNNPVPANLKYVVYCTALRYGDQEEWDFAWDRYTNAKVSTEKDLLISALGCSREPWILTRYLERALTESSGIRRQDVARVFNAVASTVIGRPIAVHYLRDQWRRVYSYIGSSMFMMNTIVRGTMRRINTKYDLMDLRRFAEDNKNELGAASRQVLQCIEQAEANIEWMERNFEHIVRWLETANAQLS